MSSEQLCMYYISVCAHVSSCGVGGCRLGRVNTKVLEYWVLRLMVGLGSWTSSPLGSYSPPLKSELIIPPLCFSRHLISVSAIACNHISVRCLFTYWLSQFPTSCGSYSSLYLTQSTLTLNRWIGNEYPLNFLLHQWLYSMSQPLF